VGLCRIQGQVGQEHVVHLGNCPAARMLYDLADGEIFEVVTVAGQKSQVVFQFRPFRILSEMTRF